MIPAKWLSIVGAALLAGGWLAGSLHRAWIGALVALGAALALGLRSRSARRAARGAEGAGRETRPDNRADPVEGVRATLAALADPTVALDADGIVVAANEGAEAFFGVTRASLVGKRMSDMLTRTDALGALAASAHAERVTQRVRFPGASGERTCDLSVGRATIGGAPASIVAIRDVTESAEAARVRTEFVANASHELRTPLAAIRAALETLDSGAAGDERMRSRVHGMIRSQVGRLEDLVRDLLDLARVESPEIQVRVSALRVAEIEEALEGEFGPVCRERRLQLGLRFDASLEGALTDVRLVSLILRNLVENATKFAHEGTRIDVRGSLGRTDGGSVLRFEVEDRGVGIPLAQQARVFERFYQADGARSGGTQGPRRGTGLGLAIVRHAARAMGGTAWLRSVLGEGTVVGVELPSPPKAGGVD